MIMQRAREITGITGKLINRISLKASTGFLKIFTMTLNDINKGASYES